MKFSIPNAVTIKVARTILLGKKNSPTILFVGGVVGVVATTVSACRATLKMDDILKKTQNDIETAKSLYEQERDDYTESDYKKDMAHLYVRCSVQILKIYAPSIVLGALSIASLTGSHNILTKRNAGLTAAYAAVSKAFGEYRGRVVTELGEDKDREFRYGTESKVVTVEDKNGSKKIKSKVASSGMPSMYAKFFDESNQNWVPTPEYNMFFLRLQQNYLNDRLQARGHVFLNEAYDALGLERTKAGAITGWVRAFGDDHIDFGIWADLSMERLHSFVTGQENCILLDFNVDGIIYDKI